MIYVGWGLAIFMTLVLIAIFVVIIVRAIRAEDES